MLYEYNALIKSKTSELVSRSTNVNVIHSIWTFLVKKKSTSSFARHKVRLVGEGRSRQVGEDCKETFSLVVKHATILTILSITMSK